MSFQSLGTPLAVIGMGCRLPAAEGLGQYWDLLVNRRSGVREVPESRMPRWTRSTSRKGPHGTAYSSVAGLLDDRVADGSTLGMSHAEAQRWDECHRNLAEVARFAWQDLVAAQQAGQGGPRSATGDAAPGRSRADAGSRATAAAGMGRTGIYVGHSAGAPSGIDRVLAVRALEIADVLRDLPDFQPSGRFADQAARLPQVINDYAQRIQVGHEYLLATQDREGDSNGAARFVGRVLGVDGPQVVVDAACASSLVALTMASMALVSGEIDTAVVGGASFFRADGMVLFSQAQSCSARGTRPFDAQADGLIAAEGYVIAILKPLAKAMADGDPIHAVISGLGLSSDGRGRSLWAPRKEGQYAAIERAYSPLCRPEDVQLIEAHATSTLVGDATEVTALGEFFRQAAPGRRFPIGSVKSNIGHTLEAAGVVSLLKVILAMQHQVMPATINLEQLSPEIPWNELPFDVLKSPRPWPAATAAANGNGRDDSGLGKYRRAAVNAFGIGGLNVHMVVDEAASAGWWLEQLNRHGGQLPRTESAAQPTSAAGLRSQAVAATAAAAGATAATVTAATTATPTGSSGAPARARLRPRSVEPIAIVGRGVVLPEAFHREAFRELLQSRRSALRLADSNRWRTVAQRELPGQIPVPTADEVPFGLVRGYEYDWKRFKIPPKQLRQASPQQFMLLDAALQALTEAGNEQNPLDRATTAVVMGSSFSNAFSHDLAIGLRIRTLIEQLRTLLQTHQLPAEAIPGVLEKFEARVLELYPALLDETGSFTASTLASRINKTLDLMGGAMAIDGQELSGLMALSIAVDLLHSGATSTVLCGAAEGQFDWLSIKHLGDHGRWLPARDHRTGPDGRQSLEARGIVGGEGAVILALQRLSDARAEGRTIYGVIQGIEVQGFGERDAARRELANVQGCPLLAGAQQTVVNWTDSAPRRVDLAGPQSLVTSARLEDQIGYLFGAHSLAEIVRQTLIREAAPRSGAAAGGNSAGVATSAATQLQPGTFEVVHYDPVGHLGRVVIAPADSQLPFLSKRPDRGVRVAAAAAAAVPTAVPAVPAAATVPMATPAITPAVVATRTTPSVTSVAPVIATATAATAVASSTVASAPVSQPRPVALPPVTSPVISSLPATALPPGNPMTSFLAPAAVAASRSLAVNGALGTNVARTARGHWHLMAGSRHELMALLERGLAGSSWTELLAAGRPSSDHAAAGNWQALLLPTTEAERIPRLTNWLRRLELQPTQWLHDEDAVFWSNTAVEAVGSPMTRPQVAWLFPGQSGVAPERMADWATWSPAAADVLHAANRELLRYAGLDFAALCQVAAAKPAATPTVADRRLRVWSSQVTVLVADLMVWAAVQEAGLTGSLSHGAAVFAGHSYGEIVACVAAGVFNLQTAIALTWDRTAAIAGAPTADTALVSLAESREVVAEWLQAFPRPLAITHENSPRQTVVGGRLADLEEFQEFVRREGGRSTLLAVPAAFHSPWLEPAVANWTNALQAVPIAIPAVPLLSSVTNRFVADPEDIRENLARQLVTPVRYRQLIERLHAQGVRAFVEVGPGQVLTGLQRQTLSRQSAVCLSAAPLGGPWLEHAGWLQSLLSVVTNTAVANAAASSIATSARTSLAVAGSAPVVAAPALAAPPVAAPQVPSLATAAPAEPVAAAPMTTVAAAAAPAAESHGLQLNDEASLQKFLVDFVVENTGYPAEMIDLDWDMEADLGIDSIKKAQLLGELRELFDLSKLQGGSLKDLRSLRDILVLLREHGRGKREWLEQPAASSTTSPATSFAPAAPSTNPVVASTPPAFNPVPAHAATSAAAGGDEPATTHPALSAAALAGIKKITPVAPPAVTAPLAAAAPVAAPPVVSAAAPAAITAAPMASASVAASAAAAPAADRLRALEQFCRDFVIERTGYPADLVDTDADLEADLGVDSIAKAQMLGELRDQFQLTVQQSGRMSLTRLKSIRDILVEVEPLLPEMLPTPVTAAPAAIAPAAIAPAPFAPVTPAATSVPAVVAPVAAAAAEPAAVLATGAAPQLDPAVIEQFLIDFVIERTGYPRELVDVNADLEADLGVDSIAKAQMLGEVREQFALQVRETGRMSLTQLRSIGDLINAIQQMAGSSGTTSAAASEAPTGANSAASAVTPTLSPVPAGAAAAVPAPAAAAAPHAVVLPNILARPSHGLPTANAANSNDDQDLDLNVGDQTPWAGVPTTPGAPAAPAPLSNYQRGATYGRQHARSLQNHAWSFADRPSRRTGHAAVAAPPRAMSLELQEFVHGVADGMTLARESLSAIIEADDDLAEQLMVAWRESAGLSPAVRNGQSAEMVEPSAHAENGHASVGSMAATTSPPAIARVTERFVMQLVPNPLPPTGAAEPVFLGAALVVGQNAIAERLTQELQLRGVTVTRIAAPESREAAIALMDEQWSHQPPLHLFLTSPYDAAAVTGGSWSDWLPRRQPGMLATFALLQRWMQLLLEHRRVADSSLLCLANLGGGFGFDSRVTSIEGGGLAGLLKAILVENWIRGDRLSMVKLIDAPANEPLDTLMPAIFRELTLPTLNIEIAWRNGQRYRVGIEPEELHVDPNTQVARGGNWVVTGGARGITAYVIRDLAARFDWTVHLLGTQAVDSAPAEWVQMPADQKKQLKMQVMQAARERKEHALNAWERVEKIIEIRESLAAMRAAGLKVHYHACDVGDHTSVGQTLDRVRAISGPIHGVIHGAGVTKDCTIERKTPERVTTCCAAKVDGAWALWDHTQNDPLEYFVAFGSIGGRFGANGTSDYSLANDMLAKQVVWFRQARPNVRSVLFHWHAWDEIGMAFRPDTRLGLELFAVNFMPAREGLEHLRKELQAGVPRAEVLITDRRYFRMFFQADAIAYESARPGSLPLIQGPRPYPGMPAPAGSKIPGSDHSASREPDVWTATLSPEDDPFLVEHRLDDKPLLPVVIAAELCAEAAWASVAKSTRGTTGQPLRVVAFEGLEATGKLHFHTLDPRDARVFVTPEGVSSQTSSWRVAGPDLNGSGSVNGLPSIAGDRLLRMACEMKSDIRTRQGQLLETNKLFAKSTMVLGEHPLDLGPACEAAPTGQWFPVEYPPRGSRFWVGNSLNWLRAIQFEQGVVWGLLGGQPLNELAGVNRDISGWVVPSALLDASLYATGLLAWSQVRAGVHLPKKIGRVVLGRHAGLGERLLVKSHYRHQTGDTATFDFTVYGEDLQPILAVQNYEIVWLPE